MFSKSRNKDEEHAKEIERFRQALQRQDSILGHLLHDATNHMTILQRGLEFFSRQKLDRQSKKMLTEMHSELYRLQALFASSQEFYRSIDPDSGEMEVEQRAMRLNTLVEIAIRMTRSAWPEWRFHKAYEHPCVISCDPNEIIRLLRALFTCRQEPEGPPSRRVIVIRTCVTASPNREEETVTLEVELPEVVLDNAFLTDVKPLADRYGEWEIESPFQNSSGETVTGTRWILRFFPKRRN